MSREKDRNIVDPVDAQVGGDGDAPGIAQTTTAEDIDAIAFGPQPLAERREQLQTLRSELEARSNADRGGDMTALIAEIERLLTRLEQPGVEPGSRASLGMVPEDRADAKPPDELDE
ncbi:MAG: hypothetical protein KKB37_00105 [Alphaproteobacteria bacterium]|nr:hypothetical protein [Alphaproteobacteria bacterium]